MQTDGGTPFLLLVLHPPILFFSELRNHRLRVLLFFFKFNKYHWIPNGK